MRMVPPFPYDTRSQAEKRVFDRLRGALDDSHVAYHSIKPTRHPYKRFPEIDFVICSEEGLYVIEIKGGRVSCQDGVWRFLDRNGHATESIEGPFRQAETALRGLMEEIRSRLPDDVCDQFTTGYGVVFPDCEWRGQRTATGTRQSAEMIASEILQLVDRGDLTPGSVTVLSPFEFLRSRCPLACYSFPKG